MVSGAAWLSSVSKARPHCTGSSSGFARQLLRAVGKFQGEQILRGTPETEKTVSTVTKSEFRVPTVLRNVGNVWGVALSHPPLTLPLTHANKGHVTRLMLSSLEFHFPAGLTSPVKLNGGGKFSLLVLRLFVPEELVPYFNRVVLEATCASQSTPWQREDSWGR